MSRGNPGGQGIPAPARVNVDALKARYQDIKAKHSGTCARCKAHLQAGTKVFWDSQERRAYCDECAEFISQGGLFGAPLQDAATPHDAAKTTPEK